MFPDSTEIRRGRRPWALLAAGIALLAPLSAVSRGADPVVAPDFRLERTLEGHQGKIWCVAFSPDGKVLASGANADARIPAELKLWNVDTGDATVTLPNRGSVRWVAFSADGKHLATAEHNGTARLRDPRSADIIHVLAGHASGLDCVVFSPDSATVATTSWDRTLKLWDANTGELLKTFVGHPDKVYTAAISPDGKSLLSGSADGSIRVWDLQQATTRFSVAAHDSLVHNVAFAPGEKFMATAGWDKTIKFWDSGSGLWIRTLEGHTAGVLAMAFSPDGKWLASVSLTIDDPNRPPDQPGKSEIKLWDTKTGQAVASLPGHTAHAYGVAFSPDGERLATASFDRTIKLWKRQREDATGQ